MRSKVREDDGPLVERCAGRDLAAWSIFIKKYSALITISIETRLKKYGFKLPRQDIEEIRQNVLASIWKDNKLEGVKNSRDISYWLAIVSGNEAIEYLRTKRKEDRINSVSLFEKIDERELIDLVPSAQLNPNDELIRGELSEKIDSTIELLPAKEKLVIKLNLIHNKKYYEISQILNMPRGTVSNYIKRAKEKLRDGLKDFA